MIIRANEKQTEEIRNIWLTCFKEEDPKYIDFYFKNYYKPQYAWCNIQDDKIVSVVIRTPHDLMFNGRVLRTSMINGVATLPEHRNKGLMHETMDAVLDACEHTELITLLRSERPALYEPYGFQEIYPRTSYRLDRNDVKRITIYGCAYEPTPLDLLKVYSNYIKRFNGFYARDLEYFVKYKQEVIYTGGKIVAYYNGKDQIMGYAVMKPNGDKLDVEELVYLDSMSLMKLLNACLQEKKVVDINVSRAEALSAIFPEAKRKDRMDTMVRLNDEKLFSKLFGKRASSVESAFSFSTKPLNLNEYF